MTRVPLLLLLALLVSLPGQAQARLVFEAPVHDFGAIAVYLMSNASRWHTGDVIKIDGGFSIF